MLRYSAPKNPVNWTQLYFIPEKNPVNWTQIMTLGTQTELTKWQKKTHLIYYVYTLHHYYFYFASKWDEVVYLEL